MVLTCLSVGYTLDIFCCWDYHKKCTVTFPYSRKTLLTIYLSLKRMRLYLVIQQWSKKLEKEKGWCLIFWIILLSQQHEFTELSSIPAAYMVLSLSFTQKIKQFISRNPSSSHSLSANCQNCQILVKNNSQLQVFQIMPHAKSVSPLSR